MSKLALTLTRFMTVAAGIAFLVVETAGRRIP